MAGRVFGRGAVFLGRSAAVRGFWADGVVFGRDPVADGRGAFLRTMKQQNNKTIKLETKLL